MAPSVKTSSEFAAAFLEQQNPEGIKSKLEISVIFTSIKTTREAITRASALAVRLGARIALVAAQVVPYPLPLTSPPVSLKFQEDRFRELASESPVEARVQVYLCRDVLETLKKVLKPHSLVVIGGRKNGWPTREKHLARELCREGHEVVWAERE
jgi:hypothetical protein